MPTECPKHSVAALVVTNKIKASHEKRGGPSATAITVMAPIQSDLAGAQRTSPSKGSVPSSATMRSEPGTSFMEPFRVGRPR